MSRLALFLILAYLTLLTPVVNAKALANIETTSDQLEAARKMPANYCHALSESRFNPTKRVVLVVDKDSFCTYLMQLGNSSDLSTSAVFSTPNSIGRVGHETKTGAYKVSRLVEYPVWVNPETMKITRPYDVDRGNPLGVAAITIREEGANIGKEVFMALHGTNHEELVGRHRVSGGCIRHYNYAIKLILQALNSGDTVLIVDKLSALQALPLKYFK